MRMMNLFVALVISSKIFCQDACFENKEYPKPVLSETTKSTFEAKLAEARADYNKDSTNADAIIWLGRRTAYLGRYEEAISIFSKGIILHPKDARFYRHRGHRYLTLRCFDKAIADFEFAAALINGKEDQVEPDGLPNAANIPTSTLQSNIWYHLGLCYYLKGGYKKALSAFSQCMIVSNNNDMMVATVNWMNITLRKLGQKGDAESILKTIGSEMVVIENRDYHQIIMLYKQNVEIADPVKFLQNDKKDLGLASFGYGLGNYLLQKGRKDQAKKVFELILDSNQWAAFGYIAAEVEMLRL